MTWRHRTDLWYGSLLLRPVPDSENAQFGGAYVSFVVLAADLKEALAELAAAVAKEQWQATSVETMKRAWDYHNDEVADDIIARSPSWFELIETAERVGLALGPIHGFRVDKRLI
ncbi:MAG: hypothetical protein H7124_07520 [Phycisphaerales bacterium]|nr:hypothetical protein [Hyphomonadaceae bacterium]